MQSTGLSFDYITESAFALGNASRYGNQTVGDSVGGTVQYAWINTLYFSLNVITSIFGIVANLLAGIVFLGHRPLRQRIPNYFLVNQCLIDFIAGLLLLLLLTITPSTNDLMSLRLICFLWRSRLFFTGLYVASMFNLAILTIERYLEVVHPVFHKLWLSRRKVFAALAISWFIGIGFKVIVVIPTVRFADGVCRFSVYPNGAAFKTTVLCNFCMELLIPVVVVAVCYALMVRSMHRSISPSFSLSTCGTSVSARIRKNILKTVLVVVIVMTITLLMKQVVTVGPGFGVAVDPNGMLFKISVLSMYVNCCANPFIYLMKYAEFKKGTRKICSRVFNAFAGVANAPSSSDERSTKTCGEKSQQADCE